MAIKEKRKTARREADFYPTPPQAVYALLEKCPWLLEVYGGRFCKWLEPCYGDGAIIAAVRRYCIERRSYEAPMFTGVELREIGDLHPSSAPQYMHRGDFLSWKADKWFDVCLTNPPFTLAQEFIDHARPMADLTIMLLRLGFLESVKRSAWWQGREPKLVVLADRPDFTGDGGDRTAYAWFLRGAPSYVPAIQIAEPFPGFDARGSEKAPF